MRYALISDIHGNYPALKAVLDDSINRNIDSYIFLGDYPMGLHYPNKVVDAIRDIKNKYIIKGNQEVYLDNLATQDQSLWEEGQFSTLYWVYRELSESNIKYLNGLPSEIMIDDYMKIHAFHSVKHYFNDTPLSKANSGNYALASDEDNFSHENYVRSLNEMLMEDVSFNKVLIALPDGVYAYGHNHVQTHLKFENKLLINPGSCGIPLDGAGYAPYSILEITANNYDVSEMRVEYDVADTIREFRDSQLHDKAKVLSGILIRQLITGKECFRFFFETLRKIAQEPFTRDEWEKGYEIWCDEWREVK